MAGYQALGRLGSVQRDLRNGVVVPKTVNDDRFVTYLMGDGVSAATGTSYTNATS